MEREICLFLFICLISSIAGVPVKWAQFYLGRTCAFDLNHTKALNDDDVGLLNITKIDFVSDPPGAANATSNNDFFRVDNSYPSNATLAFGTWNSSAFEGHYFFDFWLSACLGCKGEEQLPQSIWYQFDEPVKVVKFQFGSSKEMDGLIVNPWIHAGPTDYVFFASNDSDCTNQDSWTQLLEDTSGSSFDNFDDRKIRKVRNQEFFHCYGFQVKEIPRICDEDGNEVNSHFVLMRDIQFWEGEWTGCKEIERAYEYSHGKWNCDNEDYLEDTNCTFVCDEGFELPENVTLTSKCDGELSWTDTNSTERCQPISCPALSNDESCSNGFELYSNCSSPCDDGPLGHKRSGQVVRACQPNKTWSDPIEECKYISCPMDDLHDMAELKNGKTWGCRVGKYGLLTGEICTLYCKDGFTDRGEEIKGYCQEDESIRFDDANCTKLASIRCENLTDSDGEVLEKFWRGFTRPGETWNCNGNSYQSECSIECLKGYNHAGSDPLQKIVCSVEGKWDRKQSWSLSRCAVKKCGPPSDPDANGELVCTIGVDYNSVCTKKCKVGYESSMDSEIRCNEHQKWVANDANSSQAGLEGNESISVEMCAKVSCPVLSADKSRNYDWRCPEGNLFDSVCYLKCGNQLLFDEPITKKCLANKTWTEVDADHESVCQTKVCSQLIVPKDRKMKCSHTNRYKSSCTIQCQEGFQSVNPILRECLENGTWSWPEDECLPVIEAKGNTNVALGFGTALLVLIIVLIAIIYLRNKRRIDSTIFSYRSPASFNERVEIVEQDHLDYNAGYNSDYNPGSMDSGRVM